MERENGERDTERGREDGWRVEAFKMRRRREREGWREGEECFRTKESQRLTPIFQSTRRGEDGGEGEEEEEEEEKEEEDRGKKKRKKKKK